ncbi:MAG: hypothetical protein K2N11_00600, partial [Mucispirillum sp.]|nr:hypothetical protein [Mucispirillum sp.]
MALSKKKIIIFAVSILAFLIIIAPITAYLIANANAKSKVAEFAKSIQGTCSIQYSGVSYNILNRHLTVSNILISCLNEKVFFIKEAEFNHIVSGKPVPLNVQADLKGGTAYANAAVFKQYGEYASKLGYDNINFHGRIAYTLGKVSKDFKMVTFNISADNIGLFQGQMKVPDVYSTDINVIYDNILNNRPASFTLDFSDKGLKNTVISKFVQIADIDDNTVNEKIKNAVYKRAVKSDNRAKENYSQLEKFLLSGNTISIK